MKREETEQGTEPELDELAIVVLSLTKFDTTVDNSSDLEFCPLLVKI